ncbi:MAG TPA: phenylalanine--tRNA ligase subunit beta [Candidatus Paceibacterota bacterium]
MLVSYNWLQKYFKEPLPEPEALADIITMGVFEVESVEKKNAIVEGKNEDTVIDVKVLPDRNPYCLSHRYVAQEIAALLDTEIDLPDIEHVPVQETGRILDVQVGPDVQAKNLCKRYVGRVIEGVTVTDSPLWLKSQLEVLGQRSINSVVDLTNYVMLETGQPLHAFDADLVEGAVTVRFAAEGEKIVILDGTEVSLTAQDMVIADGLGPLAIAGVKGGKRAEVTKATTNIILEAACFDGSSVRKTSQRTGIRNDSSKRFENSITSERAGLGMASVTSQIFQLNPNAVVGAAVDVHLVPDTDTILHASISRINQRLGLDIPKDAISHILTRCGLTVSYHEEDEDALLLSVPPYRSDIRILEDVADEVGRIYGYNKVIGVELAAGEGRSINANFYNHNLIRKTLQEKGFSEICTYTLMDVGSVAILNPLTIEKGFMREGLSDTMAKKLLTNLKNADLLGLKEIKLFEIGKIFSMADGLPASGNDASAAQAPINERYSLAVGIARSKNPKGNDAEAEIKSVVSSVLQTLGVAPEEAARASASARVRTAEGDAQTPCAGIVAEIDLDDIIKALPEPKSDIEMPALSDASFKIISTYPFSARDVAVFVPGEEGSATDVINVIVNALNEDQRKLLANATLFDTFTKRKEDEPVKTSYAYRLVFQSDSRTLTEDEVVAAMKAITDALAAQVGWEVR